MSMQKVLNYLAIFSFFLSCFAYANENQLRYLVIVNDKVNRTTNEKIFELSKKTPSKFDDTNAKEFIVGCEQLSDGSF